MLFNSYIFILIFLPLALLGYFGLNKISEKLAKLFLLGMSLWFYGYFHFSYLLILVTSIVINYFFGRILRRSSGKILGRVTLAFAIVANVGILFCFKYLDFTVKNINLLFGTAFPIMDILLPLGISFYTFQQLSYVIDCYKKKIPEYSFVDYSAYVSFFPQLIAGPIVLHNEFIPQIEDKSAKRFNAENMTTGIMLFVVGLFKKVEIAGSFGRIADWGFLNVGCMTCLDTWVVMLSYTFQIYFDFSAYSEMAMGIGKMFNIDLPRNFDSPYSAKTVTEFWKRWHMTLTRFLRTYIYYPLGGNRKGIGRTYLNVLIVFLVSGIWHGANWTFLLWGGLHGLVCVVERIIDKKNVLTTEKNRFIAVIRWCLTFLFLNITWLLFRAQSVTQWTALIKRLITPDGRFITILIGDDYYLLMQKMHINNFWGLFVSVIVSAVISIILQIRKKTALEFSYKRNVLSLIIVVGLFLICMVSVSQESAFLYFNF